MSKQTFKRKTKDELKLSENSTIEKKGNFFCSNCEAIKDYSDNLCDYCFTKEKGYFLGFEIGRCPIFENG